MILALCIGPNHYRFSLKRQPFQPTEAKPKKENSFSVKLQPSQPTEAKSKKKNRFKLASQLGLVL